MKACLFIITVALYSSLKASASSATLLYCSDTHNTGLNSLTIEKSSSPNELLLVENVTNGPTHKSEIDIDDFKDGYIPLFAENGQNRSLVRQNSVWNITQVSGDYKTTTKIDCLDSSH